MDEYDVIYLDDDERNARPTVVRHTGGGGGRAVVGGNRRPGGSSVIVPPSKRPTVIHSGGSRRPGDYGPARPVVIQQEPETKKLLGDLTTGEVVELAAQILAAIQPLPGAPTGAGDVETDVENLVIYQTALATHAKRDEQLRTLGSLLGKVLK
jgi:hypothetical protein